MSNPTPEFISPPALKSLFEAVGGLYSECDDLESQMECMFDSLEKLNDQFVRDYTSKVIQNIQNSSADEQTEQAASHIRELEEERTTLECELEKVRSRAAELDNTVSQQRHEFDHQQAEMNGELTQLKTLLESQSEAKSTSSFEDVFEEDGDEAEEFVDEVNTKKSVPRKKIKKSKANDPVLDPIMAQFAKLQKQKVKRKKAGE